MTVCRGCVVVKVWVVGVTGKIVSFGAVCWVGVVARGCAPGVWMECCWIRAVRAEAKSALVDRREDRNVVSPTLGVALTLLVVGVVVTAVPLRWVESSGMLVCTVDRVGER